MRGYASFVVRTSKLAANGGNVSESFPLSDLATGQLCERLSIPRTYYCRQPPDMQFVAAQ